MRTHHRNTEAIKGNKTFQILCGLCASAVILVVTGCVGSGTGSNFRTAVETYVNDYGNGDLNVLRETPGDRHAARTQFGAIGGSAESQGVFLGVREITGRLWYIYLVGVTKDRDIQDIRMMAVSTPSARSIRPPHLLWADGGAAAQATGRYRAARLAAWTKNQPATPDSDDFEITFPAPDDVFKLEIAGNTASATDERSGARWSLVFGEQALRSASAQR